MIFLTLLCALAAAPAERITFDEAVKRALARAPAARIAADEIARVDGLLGQARAASLPSLGLTGTYTRIDHERANELKLGGTPVRIVGVREEQRQAQATLTVPLLAPGRWASWVVADRLLDLTKVSEQDVRRQVALAAGRAYLGVLAGRRAEEVSRSALELARARLDFSRARRKGGVGNALEEARAEQGLAAVEVQLENVLTGLTRAREALGLACGGDGSLDASDEPALGAPPRLEGVEDRRADVAAARARQEAAGTAVRWSWADWLPSLVATAQGTHVHKPVAPAPWEGWQVQLVLSLPIFEGGLRAGQLAERRALEREAQTQLDATLRLARSEVRVAVEAVQRQEAALAAARRAAQQARSVLDLTVRAHEAGATNSLDVSTAQQQSRDADLAMVISEDGARQARLDLLSAVGLFP